MFRECLLQIVTTYTNRKEHIQVRLRCKMKFPEIMISIHNCSISYVGVVFYTCTISPFFHIHLWILHVSVSCVVKEILTSPLFNKFNTSSWWGKSHPEFSCTLESFTCQSVSHPISGWPNIPSSWLIRGFLIMYQCFSADALLTIIHEHVRTAHCADQAL